ncbi:hypothetical protein C8J56DRAFT_1068117 [Mycena floridula]|nr:hypothetical protein C8J56DRAFT_1068117 [Mycena floridula]
MSFVVSLPSSLQPDQKPPNKKRKGTRGVAVKINDDSPACPELGSERVRNVMANSPNGQEAVLMIARGEEKEDSLVGLDASAESLTVKRWKSLISVNTLFQ